MNMHHQPDAGPPPLRPRPYIEPTQPRLYYGWVVVAVAFVTMAIAITARTSFSLFYPEILNEFGWPRALTAGAYSVGFVASVALLPIVGYGIERFGVRAVIPVGAVLVAAGFLMLRLINDPIGLYISMGLLVVSGSMAMSYITHAMFLPNWFVRNRGLATGVAFSGVGVGAIVLLPLIQASIETLGWRDTCLGMAIVVCIVIIPLNAFLQRTRPEEMGLWPDGDSGPAGSAASGDNKAERIVNHAWAATEWTVLRAIGTVRFWAMFAAFFCALFVWYALQAHQTKFLIDKGYSPSFAATALGLVAFFGIFGQIGLGALSDRIGRELAWTFSLAGFGTTAVLMVLISQSPGTPSSLVYLAMATQGLLGYGMASLFGAITAEIFAGRRMASILAIMGLGGNFGAGTGAWAMGAAYDVTGSYEFGFWLCWGVSILSILCVWVASPSRIRLVAGEARHRPRARLRASG